MEVGVKLALFVVATCAFTVTLEPNGPQVEALSHQINSDKTSDQDILDVIDFANKKLGIRAPRFTFEFGGIF